jgi:hypothetical protein
MPFTTITASSSVGFSSPVAIAWGTGNAITAVVFPSTTGNSSGAFSLQYTMDDLSLTSSIARWANVSSGAIGSAGTIFSSSSVSTDGAFFQFLSPVAGLRLGSTSGITAGPLILKVIQGDIA